MSLKFIEKIKIKDIPRILKETKNFGCSCLIYINGTFYEIEN